MVGAAAPSDGYAASIGKAVAGGAAATIVVGASIGMAGTLPATILAAPGAAAAGVLGEYFQQSGVTRDAATSSLAGAGAIAIPALGVALLGTKMGNPALAMGAALTAIGALGAGLTGVFWR